MNRHIVGPPLERIECNINSKINEICEALSNIPGYQKRNQIISTSALEVFFGKIIGKDIDYILRDTPGHVENSYMVNDHNRPTRTKGTSNFFGCADNHKDEKIKREIREDLNKVYNAAIDFILRQSKVNKHEIHSLIQFNINIYDKNSKMSWHRDDCSDEMKTFYPASATCVFSTCSNEPRLLLKYAEPGPNGRPVSRYVHETEREDSYQEGNGILFGLYGASYQFGKHKPYLDNLGLGKRISINFRCVRKELRDMVNKAQPNTW